MESLKGGEIELVVLIRDSSVTARDIFVLIRDCFYVDGLLVIVLVLMNCRNANELSLSVDW